MVNMMPDGVQKTEYMLAEAFMKLLERQSFSRISVGVICREAMVSRSAFYVHFRDKYELLRFCMRIMLRREDEPGSGRPPEQRIYGLLESVKRNQRLMRNAFAADFSQEIADIFENTFREYIDEQLNGLSGAEVRTPEERRMTAAFLAGGVSNMVIFWIREQFLTPVGEVTRCLCGLISGTLGACSAEVDRKRADVLY